MCTINGMTFCASSCMFVHVNQPVFLEKNFKTLKQNKQKYP